MVVGGGIGGLAAARHLARLLGARRDVEVVSVFSRPDLAKIDLAEEREQERRNHAAPGSRSG